MKSFLVVVTVMLMAGTAWAQYDQPTEKTTSTEEVTCDVRGDQKKVKTAEECSTLGGIVVTSPKAVTM